MSHAITYLPLEEIKPYENNPRNNDAAAEMVARSMQTFGVQIPLILDEEHVIICGHTRLKAAQSIGLAALPCIIVDDLTEAKIAALRLVDNKVAEASRWDALLLRQELEAITNIDMAELFGMAPPASDELDSALDALNDLEPEENAEEEKPAQTCTCEQCGKTFTI